MQAGGGIDHHVAGLQPDRMGTVGVLHLQFAAVVAGELRQEQRGRDVGAQLAPVVRMDAHAAVHMGAEGHPFAVAVEHRRIDDVG
ncbi:hypothetical protein D3C72_2199780 [compost metagenome]